MEKTKSIALINKEISKELADANIVRALLATTFKGLQESVMKQAIFEGITRGFKLKNFLEGDVYAIPFGAGYSLVTSIKYANKIAQKNGVWVSGPKFEMDEKKIISCTTTAYKRIGQDIGEWTATVFFDEYNTDRNLWKSKPHTMISKVCLSHVYRMACPEEMSQVYTEEEFDKEKDDGYDHSEVADDLPVITTGDDDGSAVIPETESARKIMIHTNLRRLMVDIDLTNPKEVNQVVSDLTQLEMKPINYANIIHILHTK